MMLHHCFITHVCLFHVYEYVIICLEKHFSILRVSLPYYACYMHEGLDGRAVSALGVRSRKLSTSLNGQS
jgi:hypothetical protein